MTRNLMSALVAVRRSQWEQSVGSGEDLTYPMQDAVRPYAEWAVVNRRKVGLMHWILLDLIFERQDWQELRAALPASRKVLTVHRGRDGKRMRGQAIDKTEWAKVCRSRWRPHPTDPEGAPTEERPTAGQYAQQHSWFGWASHTEDEEE